MTSEGVAALDDILDVQVFDVLRWSHVDVYSRYF